MFKQLFDKYFSLLFVVFSITFIVSTIFKPYPLSWLMKLVPMAILILYVSQHISNKKHNLFFIGLAFSACGDFFLDYDRTHWFIYGLGAFFVAHVFYLSAIWPIEKKRLGYSLLYLVYGIAMFSLIAGGLGELFIPVLLYMLVLLFMGLSTLLSTKSNSWLIMGGILFIFSDSLIGIDKFYAPIEHVSVLIMTTYYAAQFSLVKGLIACNVKAASDAQLVSAE